MNELQNLMIDIRVWSNSTFGNDQNTHSILRKLEEEVGELIDVVNDYQQGKYAIENVVEGFASCFHLLFDAAAKNGLTAQHVVKATRAKLEINRRSQFSNPDENGKIHKIKSSTELFRKHFGDVTLVSITNHNIEPFFDELSACCESEKQSNFNEFTKAIINRAIRLYGTTGAAIEQFQDRIRIYRSLEPNEKFETKITIYERAIEQLRKEL